jgi:hypothetical protein
MFFVLSFAQPLFYCYALLFAYFVCIFSVAVEGSSPPREGVILTRLLEPSLLSSEQ